MPGWHLVWSRTLVRCAGEEGAGRAWPQLEQACSQEWIFRHRKLSAWETEIPNGTESQKPCRNTASVSCFSLKIIFSQRPLLSTPSGHPCSALSLCWIFFYQICCCLRAFALAIPSCRSSCFSGILMPCSLTASRSSYKSHLLREAIPDPLIHFTPSPSPVI